LVSEGKYLTNTLESMNELFDICVDILYWISAQTGWTYKEANIYIFVVIHPVITMILAIMLIRRRKPIVINCSLDSSGLRLND
jgi:acyl-coenzyme A synthetase/AMP-(fatty) acid ligase